MAKLCLDSCARDDCFIGEYMGEESLDPYICCCCCPIMEECKQENDDIGCRRAFNGEYNERNCVECDSCREVE